MKKKKRWYFWVIISVVLVAFLCTTLVVFDAAEGNRCDSLIETIYEKFESEAFSNDFYCCAQYNYVSYNRCRVRFDSYSLKNESDIIPSDYTTYRQIVFGDFVYSTDDFLFFSYLLFRNETISYLVFKLNWTNFDDISFVASLNDLPPHSSPFVYDDNENGFFFSVDFNNIYSLYFFDINHSTFNYLKAVEKCPSFSDYHSVSIEKKQGVPNELVLHYQGKTHKTTFKQTCSTAFNLVSSNNFQRSALYQFDNYSLCLYRYNTGFFLRGSVFAVFSYNWETDFETFQGLFTTINNGHYWFGRVY